MLRYYPSPSSSWGWGTRTLTPWTSSTATPCVWRPPMGEWQPATLCSSCHFAIFCDRVLIRNCPGYIWPKRCWQKFPSNSLVSWKQTELCLSPRSITRPELNHRIRKLLWREWCEIIMIILTTRKCLQFLTVPLHCLLLNVKCQNLLLRKQCVIVKRLYTKPFHEHNFWTLYIFPVENISWHIPVWSKFCHYL